jgi:DNA-binding transcriptional MerR regulator/predicted transcriptional regulator YdeE
MLNIGEFARLGQVSPRMLRHYDETGLLRPSAVDPQTGYRLYDVAALGRLHRLLALRDLGFTLEQIRPLLEDDVPLEQLRGMLRLGRAQIEQNVEAEQARLRRVEAHLSALEGSTMQLHDVVIKQAEPIRLAEAVGTAPGYGSENLGPVFARLLPEVLGHLTLVGARPGISVGHYEAPKDDGSIVLRAGFVVGDQDVPSTEVVRVVDLPAVQVASVVHRGAMEDIEPAFEALVRWIADSGFQSAGGSRELYHEFDHEDPAGHVTELQIPVAAADDAPGKRGRSTSTPAAS